MGASKQLRTSGMPTWNRCAGLSRPNPVRSPNLAAFTERWGQSLRVECLDRILAVGVKHLTYLCREYKAY